MKNKGISGMRIGFDNDRYLKIQSEHIKERINNLGTSFIWNLAENYLTIITHPEYCRDLHRTVNSRCLCSLRMWQRS